VAARSKAWVCGHPLAGIVGPNPAVGNECLLSMLRVVRYRSLHRAENSSRGVLPNVVSLRAIAKTRKGTPRPAIGPKATTKK
jgi:hypothetical protein